MRAALALDEEVRAAGLCAVPLALDEEVRRELEGRWRTSPCEDDEAAARLCVLAASPAASPAASAGTSLSRSPARTSTKAMSRLSIPSARTPSEPRSTSIASGMSRMLLCFAIPRRWLSVFSVPFFHNFFRFVCCFCLF